MKRFGAKLKLAGGGEGQRCQYPYRLDTYGRGCQHDCSYCYAKSLLNFRKMWDSTEPAVVDDRDMTREIAKIQGGTCVRLGGMTDCMMPLEKVYRATYKTIEKLNAANVEYLVVTKGALVADDEYMSLYDPALAHFQISVTATDDDVARAYEKASPTSERLKAFDKLQDAGFDVALRVSPYIPGHIDWSMLQGHKAVIEFLRVNSWIEKWMSLDYSAWTLKEGGYRHLALEDKISVVGQARGFDEISVCEDVPEHYDYWVENVNANPLDCCNLRRNIQWK